MKSRALPLPPPRRYHVAAAASAQRQLQSNSAWFYTELFT